MRLCDSFVRVELCVLRVWICLVSLFRWVINNGLVVFGVRLCGEIFVLLVVMISWYLFFSVFFKVLFIELILLGMIVIGLILSQLYFSLVSNEVVKGLDWFRVVLVV